MFNMYSGNIHKHKENHQEYNCIHLIRLKQCKYNRDEKLMLDVFRPQLGFAVNPFAPSFDHEPPVFVGMTRDGQMTPPL